MSVPYNNVVRQAALRINAITGAIASTLETNYIVNPVASFQSAVFPKTSIYDAVITAEEKLAQAIADTGDHPYRSYILSETATLATGDDMPSTDASGVPIIGIYGSVIDAVDESYVCTEQPTEVVRRWKALSSYLKMQVYYYAMDGNGITHTRATGVKIQVCVYSASTQRTSLAANGNIILPDALEEAYVAGAIASLVRDDEFMGQAAVYRQYFNDTISTIRGGLTSVPSVATSGPTQVPAVST